MSLWNTLFGGGARAERVSGQKARALVSEGATLLDVRSPAEYGGGHIEGAINIPHSQVGRRLSEVPDGPVVVYCRSGARSAAAGRTLVKAGREAIYDLGGMSSW